MFITDYMVFVPGIAPDLEISGRVTLNGGNPGSQLVRLVSAGFFIQHSGVWTDAAGNFVFKHGPPVADYDLTSTLICAKADELRLATRALVAVPSTGNTMDYQDSGGGGSDVSLAAGERKLVINVGGKVVGRLP